MELLDTFLVIGSELLAFGQHLRMDCCVKMIDDVHDDSELNCRLQDLVQEFSRQQNVIERI